MFYSSDILHFRTGKLATVWLAATKRLKFCKRSDANFREVMTVKIAATCDEILRYVTTTKASNDEISLRFSLYLSSMLMNGTARVFGAQVQFLLHDASNALGQIIQKSRVMTQAYSISIVDTSISKVTLNVCDMSRLEFPLQEALQLDVQHVRRVDHTEDREAEVQRDNDVTGDLLHDWQDVSNLTKLANITLRDEPEGVGITGMHQLETDDFGPPFLAIEMLNSAVLQQSPTDLHTVQVEPVQALTADHETSPLHKTLTSPHPAYPAIQSTQPMTFMAESEAMQTTAPDFQISTVVPTENLQIDVSQTPAAQNFQQLQTPAIATVMSSPPGLKRKTRSQPVLARDEVTHLQASESMIQEQNEADSSSMNIKRKSQVFVDEALESGIPVTREASVISETTGKEAQIVPKQQTGDHEKSGQQIDSCSLEIHLGELEPLPKKRRVGEKKARKLKLKIDRSHQLPRHIMRGAFEQLNIETLPSGDCLISKSIMLHKPVSELLETPCRQMATNLQLLLTRHYYSTPYEGHYDAVVGDETCDFSELRDTCKDPSSVISLLQQSSMLAKSLPGSPASQSLVPDSRNVLPMDVIVEEVPAPAGAVVEECIHPQEPLSPDEGGLTTLTVSAEMHAVQGNSMRCKDPRFDEVVDAGSLFPCPLSPIAAVSNLSILVSHSDLQQELVTLEKAMQGKPFTLQHLLGVSPSRQKVASFFEQLLEKHKFHKLELSQNKSYGEIYISFK